MCKFSEIEKGRIPSLRSGQALPRKGKEGRKEDTPLVQASPLRAQARRVKDLTELKLSDLWREVKSDEDWWGDLKGETLRVVKRLLESYMEEELLEQLRAGRRRRTKLRRGYRNGYRQRSLLTELGLVQHLRIPRDREGYYRPCVIKRYQRRQETVNQLIRESFLAGVSTRRAGGPGEPRRMALTAIWR